MKKKISSSLLMASMLAVGSTGMLVSCSEDYDDDIKNLQSQIDGLATADDLTNRINEMASAIEQAKNEAIAKANAANEVALAAQQAAANAQNTAEGAQQVADAAMAKAEELEKNGATKEEVEAAREAAAAAQAFAEQAKQDADKALAELQAALDQAVAAATEAVSQAQATADNAQKTADEAKEAAQKAFDDAKALIDETAENAAEEAAKNAAAAAEALDAALKAEQVAQQGVADAANALAAAQAADGKAEEAKAAAALAQEAATKAQQTADEAKTLANQALGEISELESKLNQVIADGATKDELTSQINAAKDELKGLITAAENRATAVANTAKAAADAAQATADQALSIAQAAKTAIDAIKLQINDETTGLAALDARLKVVEAWMKGGEAEGLQIDLKAIEEKLDSIDGALKDIVGEYSTMVTSVSLFAEVTNDNFGRVFSKVTEKENTFPKEDVTDTKLTFTKDKTTTNEVSLLVRVSPTNAKLVPANITLINSQGQEISDVVVCSNVEPYDKLLTRSDLNNGLWKLTFKMAEGATPAEFEKAVTRGNNQVLFAVAVNNTKLNSDTRRVITGYDITLSADDAKPASNNFALLDNTGDWKSVADISNRFGATGAPTEYGWADASKPATAPITSGLDINVVKDDADNRSTGKKLLGVSVNEAIKIKVDYRDDNKNINHKIAGFYVTLDSKYASASDPSELNSWNNYSYVGVGVPGDANRKATLFKGNDGEITITDLGGVTGDVIGFRLYAVNLDGTLVDPDGRAFYVAVGKAIDTENTAIPGVTVNLENGWKSGLVEVADGTFINCTNVSGWKYKEGDKVNDAENTFSVTYYDEDKAQITSPAQYGRIKYVQFSTNDPRKFADGDEYIQTIDLYNRIDGTDVLAKTITAHVTKQMPTKFKGEDVFGIKIGQTWGNENTIRPYIKPEAGWVVGTDDATRGTAKLTDIFNGLDGTTEKYRFDFGTGITDVTSADGYLLTVPQSLLGTERSFNVYSIYENISAKKNKSGQWVFEDYEVAYNKTLYANFATWIFDMNYAWGEDADGKSLEPVLNWTAGGGDTPVSLEKVTVTNKRDNNEFGGSLATLLATKKYLAVKGEVHLTAGTQVDPYFTVKVSQDGKSLIFTQKSTDSSQAPYGEHKEKLTFTVEDVYGKTETITLEVTVKNPASSN